MSIFLTLHSLYSWLLEGKETFHNIFGPHSLAPYTYESIKHKADIHSCAQSL